MKNNLLALVAMLVCVPILCFSQDNFNHVGEINRAISVPNSPEAQAFARYGNTAVNMFTGTPNVGVPMYTHKGREMDLPMGLSYDGTPIKVNQLATNVGLGWNLNLGGRITRLVNGQPDEYSWINGLPYKSFWDNEVQSFINQRKNDPTPTCFSSQSDVEDYLLFLRGINRGEYDTQPDFFQVSAPGLSEMIVFDVASRTPAALNNPRLDISFTRGAGSSPTNRPITSWTITSDNGTKYYFGKVTSNGLEGVEITYTDNDDDSGNNTIPYGYRKRFHSSWALIKIESPNTKDIYEFTYDQLPEWSTNRGGVFGQIDEKDFNNTGAGGTSSIVYVNYRIEQTRLKNVKYNTEIFAKLDYGSRYDFAGINSRLDKVTIYTDYSSGIYKTFNFDQSYFTKDASINSQNPVGVDQNFIRLKLDAITTDGKTGSQEEQYNFDYIGEDSVPSTSSLGMDYMGYENGNSASVLYPRFYVDVLLLFSGANRDPVNSKDGMLASISYPTGGYTTFEYEPNKQRTFDTQTNTNPVTLLDDFLLTGSSLPPVDPNACNALVPGQGQGQVTPETKTVTFTVNQSGNYEVTYSGVGQPGTPTFFNTFAYIVGIGDGPNGICDPIDYTDIVDSNCNPVSQNIMWSAVPDVNGNFPDASVWLEEGCYQATFVSPYTNYQYDMTVKGYEDETVTVPVYTNKAGLRIKQIKDYSAPGVLSLFKEYNYPSGQLVFEADNLTYLKLRDVKVGSQVQQAHILTRAANIDGGNTPHIVYPKVVERVIDSNDEASNGYNVYTFGSASNSNFQNGLYTIPSLSGLGSNSVYNYGIQFGVGLQTSVGSYESNPNGSDLLKQSSGTSYDYAQYYDSKSVYVETNPSDTFKYAIPTQGSGGCWYIERLAGSYDPGQGETIFGGLTPPPESYGLCQGCPTQNPDVTTDRVIASLVLRTNNIAGRAGQVTQTRSKQFENGEELSQTTNFAYYNGNQPSSGRSFGLGSLTPDPVPSDPNPVNNLLKYTTTENSKGETVLTKFYYPESFPLEYGSVIGANMVDKPIQTKSFLAGDLISNQKTLYQGTLRDLLQSVKGAGTLENRVSFDKYIQKNLVEYHSEDGVSNTVIWGYNHRYPIAKIENATYDQVNGIVDYNSIQNLDGVALETALEPLRTGLTNSLVSIYTYDPIIGIKTMISPDGYKSSYVYDDFHRLLYIKDQSGNVLKQYNYNYGLNYTGGGGGNPYDPLVVNQINVENHAADPISDYSGNVSGLSGGSGDFKFEWYYQLDNGAFHLFETTINNNNFELQYNIDTGDLCTGGYTFIRFRCTVTDRITGETEAVTQGNQLSINCSGINQQ